MEIQNIITGFIVLFASLYVGKIVWQKVKSFSPKQSCGSDCGCGVKDKKLVQKL
jgi:hypothetical protein